MDVSVILCTWNNSKRLSITLESFSRIESSINFSWELVIVDNNSTDETSSVINSFIHRLPLVHVFESRQGLSYARNSGLAAAQGKLIIFTDDDVQLSDDWLKEYYHAYSQNTEYTFWGGPVESDFESKNIDYELIQFSPPSVKGLDLGCKKRELERQEYFISANWALPAKSLRKIGIFDANKGLNPSKKKVSIGEETDLMDKLKKQGYKAIYLPNAKLSHFVPKNKSSLNHIASRSRAWGFYCGETTSIEYKRKLFCVPLWFYKKLIKSVSLFIFSLLKGKFNYRAYLDCHMIYGQIESFRKK